MAGLVGDDGAMRKSPLEKFNGKGFYKWSDLFLRHAEQLGCDDVIDEKPTEAVRRKLEATPSSRRHRRRVVSSASPTSTSFSSGSVSVAPAATVTPAVSVTLAVNADSAAGVSPAGGVGAAGVSGGAGIVPAIVELTEVELLYIKKNNKFLTNLMWHFDDTQRDLIRHYTVAYDAWDMLLVLYDSESLSLAWEMEEEFSRLRMGTTESVTAWVARIHSKANELSDVGCIIEERTKARRLTAGAREEFKAVIDASLAIGKSEFNYLASQMLSKESRDRPVTRSGSEEDVKKVRAVGKKGPKKNKKKDKNTKIEVDPSPTDDSSSSKDTDTPRHKGPKPTDTCRTCGKLGHWSSNCKKEPLQARSVCRKVSLRNGFLFDTGSDEHLVRDKTILTNYTNVSVSLVSAGNHPLPVCGMGDLPLLPNFHLRNVLHVPSLEGNIVSIGKLFDAGYRVQFSGSGEHMTVSDGKGQVLLTANKVLGETQWLYNPASVLKVSAPPKKSQVSSALWHRRLGHAGESRTLGTLGVATGLPTKLQGVIDCNVCTKAKMTRTKIGKGPVPKAGSCFDLVHSDICGPSDELSFTGFKYFISFVDDYSRYAWFYPLKNRSAAEVESVLKLFLQEVKLRHKGEVKVLRTDNAKEFVSVLYESALKESNIVHELTPPYTPEYNGIAERINRTIVESIRSLLFQSGLSYGFWVESLDFACYIYNRLSHKSNAKLTPFELLFGIKPDLGHFRVFGCQAWRKIETNNKKFESRAQECILIGYGDISYVYRVLDLRTGNVFSTRNVVFNESKFPGSEGVYSQDLNSIDDKLTKLSFGFSYSDGVTDTEKTIERTPLPETSSVEDTNTITTTQEQEVLEAAFQEPEVSSQETEDSSNLVSLDASFLETLWQVAPAPSEARTSSSGRTLRAPGWLTDYQTAKHVRYVQTLLSSSEIKVGEIVEAESALKGNDSSHWIVAMKDELKSLADNDVWDLVHLPKDRKSLTCKWVLRTKLDADKKIIYKARLCVRGFSQKYGIDYKETFSPVCKMASIRVMFAIASCLEWMCFQMDVKTAFLYGFLDEKVYMDQPPFFEDGSDRVCFLKRSLYGLHQSPRMWNARFNTFMLKNDFVRCFSDTCVYTKPNLVILLYVDDILIFGPDMALINDFKHRLTEEFQMKDLGECRVVLGVQVERKRGGYSLNQSDYINSFSNKYSQILTNRLIESQNLYASVVGSLMYSMTGTRPDLAWGVGMAARNTHSISEEASKLLISYLKIALKTKDRSLKYKTNENRNIKLEGFCDSDWGGDQATGRSTSGWVFLINGTAVSWASKRQKSVSISSMEAEYFALSEAGKEALWLRNFTKELGFPCAGATNIYMDNQAAIRLATNPMTVSKAKHINLRLHWIREFIEKKKIALEYVKSEFNCADLFTKPLSGERREFLSKLIGLE